MNMTLAVRKYKLNADINNGEIPHIFVRGMYVVPPRTAPSSEGRYMHAWNRRVVLPNRVAFLYSSTSPCR